MDNNEESIAEKKPALAIAKDEKQLGVLSMMWMHRIIVGRCFIACLFYILVSVYYNRVEGWNVLDCVYYITVTITTVGFGDFHPTNDNSRIFTVFVILFGLRFIFGILNDFAKSVFTYLENQTAVIHNIKEVKELYADPFKYSRKRFYCVLCIFVLVMVGSVFLWRNEGWTFAQAFYFSVVTTTTVGYGDLSLVYESSRLFLIFYIPISVCVVAVALGNMAALEFEKAAEEKKLANLQKKLDIAMIREMDLDGQGVDRCAYLVAMLVANGVCEKERDIDPWLKRFNELDTDGSGRLDENDIQLLEEQEEARLREVEEVVNLRGSLEKQFTRGAAALADALADFAGHHEHRESLDGDGNNNHNHNSSLYNLITDLTGHHEHHDDNNTNNNHHSSLYDLLHLRRTNTASSSMTSAPPPPPAAKASDEEYDVIIGDNCEPEDSNIV